MLIRMPLPGLAQHSAELFTKSFGRAPQWIVAAPGRVNLIGEHTDYSEGFVLPMAIERHTIIVARPTGDRQIVLHSETTGETARFSVRARVERGEPAWSNYLRGVVAGFQDRGMKVPGLEGVIESSVPYGSGLGSSAALEVAMATLLEAVWGKTLEVVDKAKLCQEAEHVYAGVPCGIMDQFASIAARENEALLLDCRTHEVTPLALDDPAVTVLIINTTTRHAHAESEYAKRRAQCEEAARALGAKSLRDVSPQRLARAREKLTPTVYHRARHVLTENARVLLAADCIKARDWRGFGRLMYESHISLRDEYQVSSPELDAAVEVAKELGEAEGVYGARMTGGGFGGCVICLASSEAVPILTRKLSAGYEHRTGGCPSVFSSRPAAGAHVLATGRSGSK